MKRLREKGRSIFALALSVVLAISCLVYTGGAEVKAADDDFDIVGGVLKEYTGSDEDVVIPDTVTEIAEEAFYYNFDVVTVEIPSSVTKIQTGAFDECMLLSDITFKGGVPDIGFNAFCGKMELTFHCQEQYKDAFITALKNGVYGVYKSDWNLETFANTSGGSGGSGGQGTPSQPAADAKDIFGLEELADGSGYKVTKYDIDKANGQKDVTVPTQYNGKNIVAIGDEAFSAQKANAGYDWLTSVTLPSTIKSIGKKAFYGCTRIASITLPEGLESIGDGAFRYCNSLTEITIPASVTSIGEIAFKQHVRANLKAINVASGNTKYKSEDGVLFTKDGKVLICYPVAKKGAPYRMPNSVEEIADDAFRGDDGPTDASVSRKEGHQLSEIVFSENLKEIGDRAFEQSGLTKVTISAGMTTGKYSLAGCKDLKEVVIEEGVTEIPEAMLMGLENCETVKLPSTLKTIGKSAFDRLGVKSIELPEGLETIGENAFANSKLETVTIPSTVKKIDARAFYSANDLKSVEFAKGSKITSIGEFAFNWCDELESVKLPSSVKKLENGCFSYSALKEIQLPESITEFGDAVFAGSMLENISLPDGITKMGSATFRNCGSLKTAKMPAKLKTLGTCTFEDCRSLTSATFADTTELTYVPEDTFYRCASITKIYLPASIAETRACAFSYCDQNPVIEYANEKLKRSTFDCYNIDPGESFRLGEDGFYYTTEGLSDSDYSGTIMNEAGATGAQLLSSNDQSTVRGRSARSAMATCGCGGYGASAKLTPTSNPTFVYKKQASSGLNAGGAQNNAADKNNSAANNNSAASNNTTQTANGKVVKTGDQSAVGGYIGLLLLAVAAAAVIVYKKRTMGQR